jgi:hypothetical protein
LDAIAHSELLEDVGHVGLGRVLGHDERGSDLAIRQPTCDESHDFGLARRQSIELGGTPPWRRHRREALDQASRDRWREDRATVCRHPNRGNELILGRAGLSWDEARRELDNTDWEAVMERNVQDMIAAGNAIAHKPYRFGGGHGSFHDSAYDCSGSVSYALHGGNLLDTTMDSSELESFGSSGAGQWVTIYANSGHTFMVVAGLRFYVRF